MCWLRSEKGGRRCRRRPAEGRGMAAGRTRKRKGLEDEHEKSGDSGGYASAGTDGHGEGTGFRLGFGGGEAPWRGYDRRRRRYDGHGDGRRGAASFGKTSCDGTSVFECSWQRGASHVRQPGGDPPDDERQPEAGERRHSRQCAADADGRVEGVSEIAGGGRGTESAGGDALPDFHDDRRRAGLA